MTQIENTEHRFGAAAVLLHWSMAILVIALAGLGLYMARLPDVGFDTKKITLILYHKEFGLLVLALVVPRLAWRLINKLPQLVAHLPDWQKIAARFVHLCFYALMFALPISGLLMSSLPDFVPHDDYLFQRFIEIHKWLGYALILFIFLHVGAALKHHFVFRDDTLRRMLP
jgi:cytochrome b561